MIGTRQDFPHQAGIAAGLRVQAMVAIHGSLIAVATDGVYIVLYRLDGEEWTVLAEIALP